jgi:hypothetical protein
MPMEVFNPNPTVFSPVKRAGRKPYLSGHSLWIDETEEPDNEDEVEPIDQDEIFGGYVSRIWNDILEVRPNTVDIHYLNCTQTLFATSMTQSIRTLSRNSVSFLLRR